MSYHDYVVLCASINTAERNHPFALTITVVVAAVLTCNQVMWVTNLFHMYSVIIFWTFSSWKSRAEKHCLKRNEEHWIKTNGKLTKLTKTQRHALLFLYKQDERTTHPNWGKSAAHDRLVREIFNRRWLYGVGWAAHQVHTRQTFLHSYFWKTVSYTTNARLEKSGAALQGTFWTTHFKNANDLSCHQTVAGLFIQLPMNRLQRRPISRIKKHFDEICKKELPRVSVKRFS